MSDPCWLDWVRRLQAVAQAGLTYASGQYDRERYEEVRRIAAEMASCGSGQPVSLIHGLFANQPGYPTPKIDVRGAVFEKGKLLLVQEREDGGWTLPGGWAEVGSSARESVEREVFEESGYEVTAIKLLAVYDRNKHPHPPIPYHAYKLFFLCELRGGAPAASYETAAVGFFGEHEIPPLSLTRTLPEQIRHVFDHYRHPDWPTTFE